MPGILSLRQRILAKSARFVKVIKVAVLGSALGSNEKMRTSDVVRKQCKAAKILELHTGIAPELPSAHGHLRKAQPAGLIEAVNALLPKVRKAKVD